MSAVDDLLKGPTKSLAKRIHPIITLSFFLLVSSIIGALIWSYYQIYIHVKLLIVIPNPLPNDDDPYTIEKSEFDLDFIAMVNTFWNAPALIPALALIAAGYVYPYFKLVVYTIVFFFPMHPKYQRLITIHLNQWNKAQFIPLIAVLIICSTFSFDVVLPTNALASLTNKAEAYPGKGTLVNVIVVLCLAVCDYILLHIIGKPKKTKDRRLEYMNRVQLRWKYTALSYGGIFIKALFLLIILANIWLFVEAASIAPIRFTLDGVLADFVPDKYITANIFDFCYGLLTTSLLNDATARFIYAISMSVLFICPCVVNVLMVILWLVPFVNARYGYGCLPKYGLRMMWFMQSWNAFDWFVITGIGCSQKNIKNATKYLLDITFPEYCGDDAIVTEIFDQDCSWADASYTYGFVLVWIVVVVQWMSVFVTHRTFYVDDNVHVGTMSMQGVSNGFFGNIAGNESTKSTLNADVLSVNSKT